MDKYMPDIYQQSIYTIDYQKLKKRGIKCLLFDLDNTLVPSYIKEPNDKIKELFDNLKTEGFQVILFSFPRNLLPQRSRRTFYCQ